MTTEFKLVPVETLKFALGITRHGFKNRTDQEADKYATLKTITEILESPTPTQPIYDEAKERQLFEDSMIEASEEAGFGEPDLYRDSAGCYRQEYHQAAWGGWLACAQFRVKAGEVDHE